MFIKTSETRSITITMTSTGPITKSDVLKNLQAKLEVIRLETLWVFEQCRRWDIDYENLKKREYALKEKFEELLSSLRSL